MPRELEGWREQYEVLARRFPSKEAVGIDEVTKILACDRRTLLKQEGFPAIRAGSKWIVPLARLARWMVREEPT